MELDTNFDDSVVGSKVCEQLVSPRLHGGPTLTAYGGYLLSVLEARSVSVIFKGVQQQLELIVVSTKANDFSAAPGCLCFLNFRLGYATTLE